MKPGTRHLSVTLLQFNFPAAIRAHVRHYRRKGGRAVPSALPLGPSHRLAAASRFHLSHSHFPKIQCGDVDFVDVA